MNLELVEQIVALLGEYPVSEIAVEFDNTRVRVSKPHPGPMSAASAPAEASLPAQPEAVAEAAEETVAETWVLPAPMVGIFYHTEPPLPFGAELQPGDVVGSIESMKLMNDVTADAGGRITDILAEDGAPVEYGQALFRLAVL